MEAPLLDIDLSMYSRTSNYLTLTRVTPFGTFDIVSEKDLDLDLLQDLLTTQRRLEQNMISVEVISDQVKSVDFTWEVIEVQSNRIKLKLDFEEELTVSEDPDDIYSLVVRILSVEAFASVDGFIIEED